MTIIMIIIIIIILVVLMSKNNNINENNKSNNNIMEKTMMTVIAIITIVVITAIISTTTIAFIRWRLYLPLVIIRFYFIPFSKTFLCLSFFFLSLFFSFNLSSLFIQFFSVFLSFSLSYSLKLRVQFSRSGSLSSIKHRRDLAREWQCKVILKYEEGLSKDKYINKLI